MSPRYESSIAGDLATSGPVDFDVMKTLGHRLAYLVARRCVVVGGRDSYGMFGVGAWW